MARAGILKQRSVLPGFGLSLGYTVLYLCLIVLLPLSAMFVKTTQLTWAQFWGTVTHPRVIASYKLSFGAAAIAACINVVFGLLVAWVLVRYRFPGRRLIDGLVDLPFALPTAVAGITLSTLYAPSGWVGQIRLGTWLWNVEGIRALVPSFRSVSWLDLNYSYTRGGVVIALTFIGLPFVVRTVQPVLEDLSSEVEEAAASLGASAFQRFRKVILPEVWPALLTGFALAFARAVGEYGSVVFISGNKALKTEIAPFMIITKLGEHDVAGATAIAVVMLAASFVLLLLISMLQRWTGRAVVK
jgi:sulfate/thiosulfate transport system permease protein